jgi:hypothetical protein
MRNLIKIVEDSLAEARGEHVFMFHGTPFKNLSSILKTGLSPSAPASDISGRWATLGGVYLSSDFSYAAKAAKAKAVADDDDDDAPIAVLIVSVALNTSKPDEDIVEKALIRAFLNAQDQFGIDDQYDGDLEQYANAEEERPLDWGEKPFDRQKFYKDFWKLVMMLMSRIAGQPVRNDPVLVQRAIKMVLEISESDDEEYLGSDRLMQEWHAVKTKLVALYPRLRTREQHAASNLTIPHNVRVTTPIKFIGRNKIVAAVVQHGGEWKLAFGQIPPGVVIS